LSESQLPRIIQGKRKSTAKPTSWYERPDLLEAALIAAKEVLGKEGRAFKWLETEHPKVEGVRPIELLNTEDGLNTVKGLLSELK
jgi:6-hydroxy-3-succinoylpyridine 3-monooxygenase